MSVVAHVDEKPLAAKVVVIGHRGASALRPEHTLASYGHAIADGADFIEPDLVVTKDGVMVARHESEFGGTTDVAEHPEFAARKTTKTIDGHAVSGWFVEDFNLAELKTLRARERLPQLRSTRHDGEFPIPTLEEIIAFVADESARVGRPIGIIPEIKCGSYFRKLGLPMEDKLLATLAAHPYTRSAPVEIQSFEIANLKYLHDKLGGTQRRHRHPNIRLLQLIGAADAQPWDIVAAGGQLTYGQMMTPTGLRDIASYADAIGPGMRAIIPLVADGTLGRPTTLAHDAHAAGLELHPYTFRPENQFQAKNFWLGGDPATRNEAGSIAEIRAYLDAGIDAFFTDDPALGRKAVDLR
ncbi:glycerophosphodiester phosphodiesterase [Rhodanobacter sp. MP7CTX1]|uniref:glycerophosphodiester phosphodiesterase n=1 Tax=Rhodanobacter sp. MP7CTX1 TaxID=2723084 RepID=UPI0016083A68|nr:glycerophosphodiester phosphodiesterase [Rhodanobacter sp. MP7CTX1]MBB6188147.1 glycerophosphoryl diester phosphodiesterase [Rhodanobacter sp. MP7CTX1]